MGRFRKGAASFYIVAFATLILVIVASSFAINVISEMTRTSNDDLSQSAYDAALAGIEDAKIAFANYRSCVEKGFTYTGKMSDGDSVTCEDIMYWMHPSHADCDMVAHILGRIGKKQSGEVLIRETTGDGANNMNQAYTCAKIDTILSDYRASLSSSTTYKVVKVDLANQRANDIESIRFSWFSDRVGEIYNYSNILNDGIRMRVAFQPLNLTKAATPPTIALEMIQSAENFSMAQLRSPTTGSMTNRATAFLVPSSNTTLANKPNSVKIDASTLSIGVYDPAKNGNKLSAALFAATNNLSKNVPFVVYCPENTGKEFMCSTEIELPKPIGGDRNNNTFMFVVYLPYGKPDTDFAIEFCTVQGACSTSPSEMMAAGTGGVASLSGMQVTIDSTGRANDLYRRVEVRMESGDKSFAYAINALELTEKSDGTDSEMEKDMTVTSEYNTYTDLPDFSGVTTAMRSVRVYPRIDGVDYPAGSTDFKFDVYIDDSIVARNARTWSGNVRERSVVRVEAHSVEGYELVNGVISETISQNVTMKPEWVVAYYPVEVNTKIGSDVYDRGYEGFKYNIWLNNRLVGDGVEYYYNDHVKYNSIIKIQPIARAGRCTSEIVTMAIKRATTISVPWSGSCLPRLNVTTLIDGEPGPKDGFTFNVYMGEERTPLASNVTSFNQRLAAGSKIRVVANNVPGYDVSGGSTIEIARLEDDRTIQFKWVVKRYAVDVNPIIDDVVYEHGLTGYEFDVYLDGRKVATKVTDYYNTTGVPFGTRVTVKPYSVSGYVTSNIEKTVSNEALVLNPVWHRGKYKVDVNVIVNGTTYSHGVYGITFDVYVNGVLTANDVTDFYQDIDYGAKVRVKANNKSGFRITNGDMTKTVNGNISFSPIWASDTVSVYSFDVNSVVNGTEYSNGADGFTFSAYVSGNRVASNVIDLSAGVVGGSIVRIIANEKNSYTLTNGDDTKTANGALVFKPTWTRNTTTINYNGNGGSGSVASQVLYGGESVALRGNAFTWAGHTFTGWNTKANGTGTSYSAGNIYVAPQTLNNVVTLYAQWRESPKVTIAYNANGGTGTVASHTVFSGTAVTIKANGFSRNGYVFKGWNTKANGSGTGFSAGQSWTPIYETSTTVTLYAQWEVNAVVTIVYNANGGTGTVSSHSVNSGSAITIKANGFTRSGFTFNGWNTKPDGTGTSFAAGQSWTPNYSTSTEVILYANWNYNGTYIQDLTLATCQSNARNDSMTVADRRDNNLYKVRYIGSGDSARCWMVTNLKIAPGTTVTSALSNVTSDYKIPTRNCRNDSTGCTVSGADGSGNQTVYYNYCAATAGTICNHDEQGTYSVDICPKGWRLPTRTEATNVARFSALFSPVRSSATVVDNNTAAGDGFWWTSTYCCRSSWGNRQYLLHYSGGLSTTSSWNERNYQHFIRCVKK
ncbi:InlB B-repeat-containing protein [Candidatus Saccharibacteria bacterium]|nr:InlB B-repeat-containing protein [Candidatus Saccharibacteria bacterium]